MSGLVNSPGQVCWSVSVQLGKVDREF